MTAKGIGLDEEMRRNRRFELPIGKHPKSRSSSFYLSLLMLRSGDIQLNPGPGLWGKLRKMVLPNTEPRITMMVDREKNTKPSNKGSLIEVLKELKLLRKDLNSKTEELALQLSQEITNLRNENGNLRKRLEDMECKQLFLQEQIEEQGCWLRRNNLVFKGVPEVDEDGVEDCEKNLRKEIERCLEVTCTEDRMFEHVCRVGFPVEGECRKIVARCLHYKDKDQILGAAHTLPLDGAFAVEDVTVMTYEGRK